MFEMKISRRFRAYFLRIGYTTRERAPSVGVCPEIKCVTYVPRRTYCGYENVADVMERVRKDLTVRGNIKPLI